MIRCPIYGKRWLWLWIPLAFILGAVASFLVLGGLVSSPDKAIPSSSSLQPSEQKRSMEISAYVEPKNSAVRDTAVSAIGGVPSRIEVNSESWKIWQINYWVANNISYVSDPKGHEYFAYASETLETRGGDCDDFAILLASMYESVGLDAAIASINTDDDGKADHITCIVYYSKSMDSFIDEERNIMEKLGLISPTNRIQVSYFDAVKLTLLSSKYTTGIWIIADPPMANVKDMAGCVIHRPYTATSIIDVSGE